MPPSRKMIRRRLFRIVRTDGVQSGRNHQQSVIPLTQVTTTLTLIWAHVNAKLKHSIKIALRLSLSCKRLLEPSSSSVYLKKPLVLLALLLKYPKNLNPNRVN